jgi:transcriptional regulator with XRE-family HTH domain
MDMDAKNIDYTSMSDDRLAQLLGEFIKHHRIDKNISQDELATKAGLSRPTISLMERGKSMNLNSIIRVLRVLDLLYLFDAIKITQTISPIEMLKIQEKQSKRSSKKRS